MSHCLFTTTLSASQSLSSPCFEEEANSATNLSTLNCSISSIVSYHSSTAFSSGDIFTTPITTFSIFFKAFHTFFTFISNFSISICLIDVPMLERIQSSIILYLATAGNPETERV